MYIIRYNRKEGRHKKKRRIIWIRRRSIEICPKTPKGRIFLLFTKKNSLMPSTTKITGRWPYPATTQQIQSVLLYCSLQQQWRRPTTCRNNRIFKRERGKKKQPESEKRQDKMALCKWEKTACATQHYRAMSLYNIKRKSVDSIKVAPRRNKTSSKRKKKENNHKKKKK